MELPHYRLVQKALLHKTKQLFARRESFGGAKIDDKATPLPLACLERTPFLHNIRAFFFCLRKRASFTIFDYDEITTKIAVLSSKSRVVQLYHLNLNEMWFKT